MTDLTNQVAIITGASRGIGKATALLLALQGAKVVAVARSEAELEELTQKTQGLASSLTYPMRLMFNTLSLKH